MSTPCILAVGTRTAWRGVPCKQDGDLESTGLVVVDRIVRLGGVVRAAKAFVDDAPLGWTWAGGEPLTEVDDFLTEGGLSDKTPKQILDRHIAIYLLDPSTSRLDVFDLPEQRWHDPAVFRDDGFVLTLPRWYPQPRSEQVMRTLTRPDEVTKELRAFCLKNDLRWPRTDRRAERLGRAPSWYVNGCAWLFLPGVRAEAYVRCFVGNVAVTCALNASGTQFTAVDQRLRTINLNNVERAQHVFQERDLKPTLAIEAIRQWLSPRTRSGQGSPMAS